MGRNYNAKNVREAQQGSGGPFESWRHGKKNKHGGKGGRENRILLVSEHEIYDMSKRKYFLGSFPTLHYFGTLTSTGYDTSIMQAAPIFFSFLWFALELLSSQRAAHFNIAVVKPWLENDPRWPGITIS